MKTTNDLVWQIMLGACAIIILGGGAWATNINNKVERIATMEANIQYIQTDISDIKTLIKRYINKGE